MVRDFAAGLKLFATSWRLMNRNRRLWLLGAVPALIAMLVMVAAIVAFGWWAGDLVAWATPFADGWSADARDTLRIAATLLLILAVFGVAVITYGALTLLIGGPFYEYIAERIEDLTGGDAVGPPVIRQASWLRMFLRGLRDSVLLVALSVLIAVPLFCLGFVPVIGQTVIPVLAASAGGWILALELVGVPFARRGLRLGDRHRALRTRPWLTLGFGMPVYLLCLVPLLAIVVMPVAAAGGTMLARQVLPAVPAPTRGDVAGRGGDVGAVGHGRDLTNGAAG